MQTLATNERTGKVADFVFQSLLLCTPAYLSLYSSSHTDQQKQGIFPACGCLLRQMFNLQLRKLISFKETYAQQLLHFSFRKLLISLWRLFAVLGLVMTCYSPECPLMVNVMHTVPGMALVLFPRYDLDRLIPQISFR